MKVRMRTNIGTVHAKAIGVDAGKCKSGEEVVVDETAGKWLVDRKMADELPDEDQMRAVPVEPMRAVPGESMHPHVPKSNRPPVQRSKPFEKQTSDKE